MAPVEAARRGAVDSAQERGERWLDTLARRDVLEAYELTAAESSLGLAVARKQFEDEVRVLSYVVRPRHLNEVALLALRRPGRPADIFTYATSQIYGRAPGGPQAGAVIRASSASRALFLAAAAAGAVELLIPALPGDYRFEAAGQASIEAEPCVALVAFPIVPDDDLTELRLWISERTGIALKREYRSAEGLVQTVRVPPESVRRIDGVWVATIQQVRTAKGDEAELELVNSLPGVELPERLFTRRSLQQQRFPSF